MVKTIVNSFRIPEIRKKLAFTAAMLLLYRVGAFIPAPGINIDAVESIADNFNGSNVLGFLNLFSGGSAAALRDLRARDHALHHGLDHPAAAAGASIPSLEKLRKEGEVGQQKITQYTRYLTVALAFVQSLGYAFLFRTFAGGGARA